MPQIILQRFIRGDVISTSMVERDEIGRDIGGVVIVDAPVSKALRDALNDNDTATTSAQDTVITAAKAAKQADPEAQVDLVATLLPAAVADISAAIVQDKP